MRYLLHGCVFLATERLVMQWHHQTLKRNTVAKVHGGTRLNKCLLKAPGLCVSSFVCVVKSDASHRNMREIVSQLQELIRYQKHSVKILCSPYIKTVCSEVIVRTQQLCRAPSCNSWAGNSKINVNCLSLVLLELPNRRHKFIWPLINHVTDFFRLKNFCLLFLCVHVLSLRSKMDGLVCDLTKYFLLQLVV